MWPFSISVGVGNKAIAVGTDDPRVIDILDAWRIADVGAPTDYCVELDPPAPNGRGQPQPLPGLYHGSTALLRSRDTDRLVSALLRILGSYTRPADEGQVRIALMPVAHDGIAILAPPDAMVGVPDRWLAARGIEAFHTISSLVDIGRGRVLVDPPLGNGAEPTTLAFDGWWLPRLHSSGALSPGFAVAAAMTLVSDVSEANAASALRAVATLVERSHPALAPPTVAAVKEGLLVAFPEVASR